MAGTSTLSTAALDVRDVAKQLELDFGGSISPQVTVSLPIESDADGQILPRQGRRLEIEGSTEEAAKILGVSRQTVRMMCLEGRLRHWRVGRCFRPDLVDAQRIKDASEGGPRRTTT